MSDQTECQCVECQGIAIRKAASQRARDEITRLRAQLAEAQRDAERWRWYRNHRVTHGSVLEEDIDSAMTAKEGG